MPVAAAATEMLCRLIILPMTPPLELEAAISAGYRPQLVGRHHLQVAEQRVGEVSLPVRKTPSQPSRR